MGRSSRVLTWPFVPSVPITEGPLPDAGTDGDDVGEGQGNSVLRRREAPDEAIRRAQPTRGLANLPEVTEDTDDALQEGRASTAPSQSGAGTPVILWTSELTAADVVQKYLDKNRCVRV